MSITFGPPAVIADGRAGATREVTDLERACYVQGKPFSAPIDKNAWKASLRKLKLRYHPDKNPENPELATEIFKTLGDDPKGGDCRVMPDKAKLISALDAESMELKKPAAAKADEGAVAIAEAILARANQKKVPRARPPPAKAPGMFDDVRPRAPRTPEEVLLFFEVRGRRFYL